MRPEDKAAIEAALDPEESIADFMVKAALARLEQVRGEREGKTPPRGRPKP